MTDRLFFELLQVAVGNRSQLSCVPTAEEWEEIYETSKRQSLVGIAFAALERLPREQMPPGRRIRQWAVKADKIREQNRKVSAECRQITDFFNRNGFRAVILKGQGNYANYPKHLQGLRSAGDIDVWCPDAGVKKVIEFCQGKKKGEYVYYHNMDFPVFRETPVEVHYRPTWLYNPFRNRVLQQYFLRSSRCSGAERSLRSTEAFEEYDGYRIPSVEFNVVFQLLHLYKHIFEEGIGLRQLLDYYYVIESLTPLPVPCLPAGRRLAGEAKNMIQKLGMEDFARAVMYVLGQVFALPKEKMPWQPDGKRGRKLLDEIMTGGNFGHYDERYNWAETTNGSMEYRGAPYAMARLRHNQHFLWDYPSEVLWEPPFRLYHWLWRKFKLWRYK